MPFEGEFATGESLLSLEQSQAFREFKGRIRVRQPSARTLPTRLQVHRNHWLPTRVVAIDGSTVSEVVRNGFPMAEASLLKVAIISIDLSKLMGEASEEIPSPRTFYEMESAYTFDHVLPGANIDRPDVPGDTPRRYFRQTAYDAFCGRMDNTHETLLETVRAIAGGLHSPTRPPNCPVEDCPHTLLPVLNTDSCSCEREEILFETDTFRFSERFSEVSSNGEAHGEVRQALEIVALINVLRFFAGSPSRTEYLRNNVFIVDGPLALFGHPAWLTSYVRNEFERIGNLCRAHGFELAVFGYQKSGAFVDHFENLDYSTETGPRSALPVSTAFALDSAYINRNITLRPADAKPHGQDTYFGRTVFYKNRSGEHAVINTAMTNRASRDFSNCDAACYPRLGDMLNVLDDLATYLYCDGFMPLVRAHAHAAIPLRRGGDLIRSLFENKGAR